MNFKEVMILHKIEKLPLLTKVFLQNKLQNAKYSTSFFYRNSLHRSVCVK